VFKKSVSSFLIVSQLCLGANFAFAGDQLPEMTAERQLVETVLTLKGLALSDQDMHRQLEATLKAYDGKAPAEGRTERLEKAFVDMRILSPQQARTFGQGTRDAEEALARQDLPTPEAHARALQAQLELFARINPVGAQFSACTLGWSLTAAGVVAVIVGLIVANDNPTCHPDYNRGYSCQHESCRTCYDYDNRPYDCDCHYYTDTCYPTTCDIPGYYPNRQAGNITAIAGGVAAAAGLVILIVNRDSCW
jgi:hypothetical protein